MNTRGRPSEFPIKKLIAMDQETVDGIESYRRREDPIPNWSEAVRAIIRDWLQAHAYLPKAQTGSPSGAIPPEDRKDKFGYADASGLSIEGEGEGEPFDLS